MTTTQIIKQIICLEEYETVVIGGDGDFTPMQAIHYFSNQDTPIEGWVSMPAGCVFHVWRRER